MRKPNPLLPHKEGEASTCEDSRVCDALIKKETAIKGRTGGSVANKAETGSAHRRAGVLKRAGGGKSPGEKGLNTFWGLG